MTEPPKDRVFIGELAALINRRPNTVRSWEKAGRLPKNLLPYRNDLENGAVGWRYWTSEQVAQIVEWMKSERLFPGAGLVHFNPDAAQIEAMIARMREPRAA